MYKEIIICFVIIVGVVIINNLSQKYTDKIIEEKRNDLYQIRDKIKAYIDNDNNDQNNKNNKKSEERVKEEIFEYTDETLKEWKKQYFLLAIYLEHDELEKVEKELVSLKANAEVKNYDEMIENIEMSIFALEHLKEKEVFNPDNFF